VASCRRASEFPAVRHTSRQVSGRVAHKASEFLALWHTRPTGF